jgi:hypothetical protein
LYGKQLNGFDKYQGLVFTHSEIDIEGTNSHAPNLQAQERQSIKRFAKLGWIQAEMVKYFMGGAEKLFPAPFAGSLALKAEESVGNGGRVLDLVRAPLAAGGRHGYFFLRFRDSC